jgi:hypothetical protein
MGQCSSRLAFAVDEKSLTGVETALSTNKAYDECISEAKKTMGCSETDSSLSSTPVKIIKRIKPSSDDLDVRTETAMPSSQPISSSPVVSKSETYFKTVTVAPESAKLIPQSTPKKHTTSTPITTLISPFASSRAQILSPTGSGFYGQSSDISQLSSPSIFLDGLDTIIIPEEVDPDAPSDEEESYQRFVDEAHEKQGISKWEMEPGPIRSSIGRSSSKQRGWSPPRPMTAVKCRSKHVTRPTSIIRHHPHISPPPGSAILSPPPADPAAVDRQTLAEFNKLKIQVQLEEKALKQTKRIQKLEDRLQDMQVYKRLLREFEELQETISVNSQQNQDLTILTKSASFDLKETESWFYDFQSVDIIDISNLEEDENSQYSQQSHLSLLQRKYFAAKKHSRNTLEKINKLEKLLKDMNERKSKESLRKETQNHNGFSKCDYGPAHRQDVSSSLNSVVSDYGPAKRRGSNASIISDCCSSSKKSVIPVVITAQSSQLEISGLNHEDVEGLKSEFHSCTPERNEFDKSKEMNASFCDLLITPKRSGNAPMAQSILGPLSKEEMSTSKEHNNSVERVDPFNFQNQSEKASNLNSSENQSILKTFPENSPTGVNDTYESDQSKINAKIYHQEAIPCIHAMSKEEFLKMADDQFEELKSINKSPKLDALKDEDVMLEGRQLNY